MIVGSRVPVFEAEALQSTVDDYARMEVGGRHRNKQRQYTHVSQDLLTRALSLQEHKVLLLATYLAEGEADEDIEAVLDTVEAAVLERVPDDVGVLDRVDDDDGVVVRVPVRAAVPVFEGDVEGVPVDVWVVVSVPVPDGTYQAVLTGANATPRKTVPLAAVASVVTAFVVGAY